MKMIVLMCVEQYIDQARKILKDINIKEYSESDMFGVKNIEEDESDNWFAQKHFADNSHIIFTIVNEKEAETILATVKEHNQKSSENINAFQLNIEKAVM